MRAAVPVFLYRYGDPALLDNYCKALRAAGMTPVVSALTEQGDGCAGLLLPGGYDSDPRLYGQRNRACRNIDLNRDRKELELVRRFCAAGKPILGICRGHQLLNIALGGDLIQDIAEKARHMEAEGVDQLHEIRIAPGSFLAPLYGGRAVVTSAHHQAVGRLASGLRAAAWTEDGLVEAVEHVRLPLWGVQFHPERQAFGRRRTGAADGAGIFGRFRALCVAQSLT